MLLSRELLDETCTLHCLFGYPVNNGLHVLNLRHSFFRQKYIYLIHLLNDREDRVIERCLVDDSLLSTR
jgi:hypothetical protein